MSNNLAQLTKTHNTFIHCVSINWIEEQWHLVLIVSKMSQLLKRSEKGYSFLILLNYSLVEQYRVS